MKSGNSCNVVSVASRLGGKKKTISKPNTEPRGHSDRQKQTMVEQVEEKILWIDKFVIITFVIVILLAIKTYKNSNSGARGPSVLRKRSHSSQIFR